MLTTCLICPEASFQVPTIAPATSPAAKAGVVALTRAAAVELAPRVRVNAVAPGFTATPFTERLLAEGYADILCEGGPHLARELLEAGVVDELCVTTVPTVIAGDHLRLAAGAPVDVPLRLHGLIAAGDTLLARWFVSGPVSG